MLNDIDLPSSLHMIRFWCSQSMDVSSCRSWVPTLVGYCVHWILACAATVFMLGVYLMHIAWAGVQGSRIGRPSAYLICLCTETWLFQRFLAIWNGADFFTLKSCGIHTTFGDTLFSDDINERIAIWVTFSFHICAGVLWNDCSWPP